jgi:hypothetical protein
VAKRLDDRPRVLDGKRRLGQERDAFGVVDGDGLGFGDGRDERDAFRRLSERALHLFVMAMPDQDDSEAEPRVANGLQVDLGHERAGRVDHREPPSDGVPPHLGGNAVSGKNYRLAVGNVGQLVDEAYASGNELLHDVSVVDDLPAHVHGAVHGGQCEIHDVDRADDTRAETPRGREEHGRRKRGPRIHRGADSTLARTPGTFGEAAIRSSRRKRDLSIAQVSQRLSPGSGQLRHPSLAQTPGRVVSFVSAGLLMVASEMENGRFRRSPAAPG